jgi:hypothetical protein
MAVAPNTEAMIGAAFLPADLLVFALVGTSGAFRAAFISSRQLWREFEEEVLYLSKRVL